MNRIRSAAATLAVATTLTAGAVALTAPSAAGATTPPPWQTSGTDPNRVGTLTFFDSTGAVITSGRTDTAPFAAYVQGSQAIRTGDTKAVLYGYAPAAGKDPGAWSGQQLTAATSYGPVAGSPSSVSTTLPVVTGSAGDTTIADLTADYPNTSTASGYARVYELRLRTNAPGSSIGAGYDVADIVVDPTTKTWTELYPTDATGGTSTPTTHATVLAISATAQVTAGQKVTVNGLLRDSDAGNARIAGQTLTLLQRSTNTGAFTKVTTATTSSTGAVSVQVTPGTNRQFAWSYAGTTSGAQPYAASTSSVAQVHVAQSVTAYATSSSIKSGANVKLYGAVSPLLVGEKIYLQARSGNTYKNVPGATGVVKKQKLPNGKTTYGYVLSLNPRTKATYVFRAYAPATTSNTAGYSAARSVRVS